MAPSARGAAWSPLTTTLAVAGALMVLFGAHLPALEIKLLGPISYSELPGNTGAALQIAAVGALLAVVFRMRGGLSLCAVGLWIALLWPGLRAGYEAVFPPERDALDELGDALGDALGEAVGRTLGDDLLRITGLREGLFVLLAGCVLVSLGAFRRR